MSSIYQAIGGERVLRELVENFYQQMDKIPEAKGIRAMHAKNLRVSVDKLFMFLSGFFGGPNLYIEQHGHPRLRQRHLPFKIGTNEANQWILCMEKAIDGTIENPEIAKEMMSYFIRTALHMRNQVDDDNALDARFQKPVLNSS